MRAAAKYSPQCLARKLTTRTKLICIWTFKSEGIANVRYWHKADMPFDAEHVCLKADIG
jgi:hypothetical protein